MTADIRLDPILVPEWPQLAWVANVPGEFSGQSIPVFHGRSVETNDQWCVEAAWPGDFASADFDRTDLVFGSGARIRGQTIVFVSASTTVDRLWVLDLGEEIFVGNTLPGVLTTAGRRLVGEYLGYPGDMNSIIGGVDRCRQSIPVTDGEIRVVYDANVVVRNGGWSVVDKPALTEAFSDFSDYRDFLIRAANKLGENCLHPDRAATIARHSTVSSGYDSPVGAILCRFAGGNSTSTLTRARSNLRIGDSGESIAGHLGMECRVFDSGQVDPRHEEFFWSVIGDPADINLAPVFESFGSLTLLFTGFHGDKVWDRHPHDLSHHAERGDLTGLGLTEFRLHSGVFHCPVPFWGLRQIASIQRISRSSEMAPWGTGTDYDRPISRRIIEDAGVPGELFGVRKKATTVCPIRYRTPLSSEKRSLFREYLRNQGFSPKFFLQDIRNAFEGELGVYVRRIPGFGRLDLSYDPPYAPLVFQWANERLCRMYYFRGGRLAGDRQTGA